MVAFANTSSSHPDAAEGSGREEKVGQIERLLVAGKREFFSNNFNVAITELGQAVELAVEVYGDNNAAVYDAHVWYGRAILELCRLQEDVLDNAAKTAPEPADDNTKDVPEVKEGETEIPSSVEATASQEDENEPEVDDEMDDEEEEDEEEPSDIQIAWEVFETARTICEQQEQNKEWVLKKADVLCFLAEVSLLNNDFDKAVEDLQIAIELQKQHLGKNDRIVAQSYLLLARSYKAKDDYESAAQYYTRTKETLLAKMEDLRSTEVTDEEKQKSRDAEIDDLNSIVADLDLKIQDAEESKLQIENNMDKLRTRIGLPAKSLSATTSGEANDITNKIRKPPAKRPAEPEASVEAKKIKCDEENEIDDVQKTNDADEAETTNS